MEPSGRYFRRRWPSTPPDDELDGERGRDSRHGEPMGGGSGRGTIRFVENSDGKNRGQMPHTCIRRMDNQKCISSANYICTLKVIDK